MSFYFRTLAVFGVLLFALPVTANAADWPMWRRDVGHSGRTDEQLDAKALALAWEHRPQPPQPAWDGPARWDAFGNKKRLNSLRDYDEAYHVCVVGTSLYYASSADDAVHCIDTRTGKERWAFIADGPVRIVPTWSDGLLYFGSDDGCGYCVQANDGRLVWKMRVAKDERRVINDGRLNALYPVRTGVLVDGGTAYFAASLLPWNPSYLAAVDAKTGKAEGPGRYVVELNGLTMEGALLATADRLVVPQGRVSPALIERASGKHLGALHTAGAGSFALLTPEQKVFHGPGNRDGALIESSLAAPPPKKTTRAQMAQFPGGRALAIGPRGWYLLTHNTVAGIDPETRKPRWQIKSGELQTLALAGDTLFVGGKDQVTGYNVDDGKVVWQATVRGRALGLAIADGALFVSTDEGPIQCYRVEKDPAVLAPRGAPGPEVNAAAQKEQPPRAKTDLEAGITVGPYVPFPGQGVAIIRWQTAKPSPTVFEFVDPNGYPARLSLKGDGTDHAVPLVDMRHRRDCVYSIETTIDGQTRHSPQHTIETYFNYTLPEVPAYHTRFRDGRPTGHYADVAGHILKNSGINQGICLVLGRPSRLTWELAHQSRLKVIVLEKDAVEVDNARRVFVTGGVYGTRIEVLHLPELDTGTLPGHFANLIVSEEAVRGGDVGIPAAEVARLLRPDGGTALLGHWTTTPDEPFKQRLTQWAAGTALAGKVTSNDNGTWLDYTRPPLAGTGQWTHQYGSATNASFAGETLAGVKEANDLEVQWVGRPGPRYHPDRSGRKPGPLAAGGRLFAQGLNRIIAIDQYNGTILWSLEMPNMLRMNMPRDTSNWCADEKHLYVAVKERCWQIDAASGNVLSTRPVVKGPHADWTYDWGYVARVGERLVGSAVKHGSTYTDFWGEKSWYESGNDKVLSDNLFAIAPASGTLAWEYRDGLIVNSTICAGGERIFFVECRAAKVKDQPSRRLGSKSGMWDEAFHIAIDAKTGKKLWERPLAIKPADVALAQSFGGETLVLVSSARNRYYIYGINAADGAPLWQAREGWGKGKADHGSHLSIPAIVGDRLYVRPAVFELKTGKKLPLSIPVGGCGTYACTTAALFQRGGSGTNALVWDAATGKVTQMPRLRPDCWLSTIPAGGMLLSPESGGGCSCGVWMETSVGFMPRNLKP